MTVRSRSQKRSVSMNSKKRGKRLPLFRICLYVLSTALIIALCVTIPLGLVWKQAYITRISLEQEMFRDSSTILNRQIAALNMHIQKLSALDRIEAIARNTCGLEYPLSTAIVVVHPEQELAQHVPKPVTFWALLKRSFLPDKG